MGSGLSQEAESHDNGKNIVQETKTSQLPHHHPHAILKDADTTVIDSSDYLFAGVFLNKNTKVHMLIRLGLFGSGLMIQRAADSKYWVDKISNGNCFLVFARALSITWAEDNRYWHWPCVKETSEVSVDVAELLNVCWLEIHGKFEMAKLTPGIKYEVVFVVMLKDPAYGWEVPINVRLILPDGNTQKHKQNLTEKPRSKWFEIMVGEFTVQENKEGCVEFSLYEYEGGVWKRGLLVKGAAIRPKN